MTERVETSLKKIRKIAMEKVLAYERDHSRNPKDVSGRRGLGYDIATKGDNGIQSRSSGKISVVIPALNEEETIRTVLESVSKLDEIGEVIVIDGGSVDGTAELAEKAGATVLIERGAGWGKAVRKGLQSAKGEFIVIIDADASYNPNEIPKLVRILTSDEAIAAVVGSRPVKSRATKFSSWIFRILFNTPITDVVSSFIAARGKIMRDLEFSSSGFSLSVEILTKSIKERYKVVEVPVTYQSRIGRSKLSVFRDGLHIFREILRMWFQF